MKRKIFISSVQAEFSEERKALHDYLYADPLLGKFFEPFLFEHLPAVDQKADKVYLKEVERCDIYLGIFGKSYGSQNAAGVSPTQLEFEAASKLNKTRFIFISDDPFEQRDPRESALIEKAQSVVVRRQFTGPDDLKAMVYASLIRYLEENEIIRTVPFDASLLHGFNQDEIDEEKIRSFVRLAKSKRGFPISDAEPVEKILIHLDLLQDGRLTNAAILLFGKKPQRRFINSEVRCASFAGTIVEKPIPSYKVFKGTVFELVDQALEFVLSKLDYRIETRAEQVSIPGSYEIPKEVVAELLVNAIAHRDYNSNGSVQVMVFRDRVEVWNPGSLPLGWTTDKLKQLHTSVPANPLLAEPLYLTGYIERMGTGTTDIVRKSLAAGLAEPQFIQTEEFRAILFRNSASGASLRLTPQVTPQVKRLVLALRGELTREELQKHLKLKDRKYFRRLYLGPALNQLFIEVTQPGSINSPTQKYRLTELGKDLKEKLKNKYNGS